MQQKKGKSFETVEEFDKRELKHVTVKESKELPTVADLYMEMLPDKLTDKIELSEIKSFVRDKLKSVKSVEYSFVPTLEMIEAEKVASREEVKIFDRKKLKHVDTVETDMVPTLQQLRGELVPDYVPSMPELHKLQMFVSMLKTMAEVKTFKKSKLRHSDTIEKNTLPGLDTLWSEMLPDELPTKAELKELVKFAHSDLKHVKPNVKVYVPTSEEINEEKKIIRSDVKYFDKGCLRRVSTVEKNPLPTQGDICAEMLPDYIPPKPELAALSKFIKSTLHHVKTLEKRFVPTLKGTKYRY
ncbi:hypothetical protein MXB_3290 [Myxobolus squamalis]|nr:hypothetical protein MXB_3290 [Myxobolus squamalis]